METRLIAQASYTNPEFEAYYTKLEKEQLAIAAITGQQDGLVGKPASKRHYNIQIISSFKAAIQKAIDYNYSLFPPISSIAVTKELRNSAAENILLLEKDKNAKEKKLLFLQHEQTELKGKVNYISSKLKLIIPAIFGISEGVLVYTILQTASFPGLVKFFLSIAIALASAFGLSLGANFICNATTTPKKQQRFAVVILMAFIVAAGLGIWRAGLYSTSMHINAQIDEGGHATQTDSFSSLPFILISFISFVVALAFEIKHWQTDEQKQRVKQYEEKLAEVKKIEQERQTIKKQIDTTKQEISVASAQTMQQQEYAFANERRLISLAQQMVNQYESANVEHRLDGSCPSFFGEPITADFKLYFADIFNTIKQKR